MYAVRLADDGRSVATLRVHLAAILGARRLARFNGVPRASFPLFLKECEFRSIIAMTTSTVSCWGLSDVTRSTPNLDKTLKDNRSLLNT
jgi:hypothetical protein